VTASLTVVPRRRLTILLPTVAILAAASLGAGCSTVDSVDSDASARVNDAELSPEDLTELVDVLSDGQVTNGDAIRSTLSTWVLVEVAGAQFESDGTELTDDEFAAAETTLSAGLPAFADLTESTRDTLVRAQATLEAINGLSDGAAFVELATTNADIFIDPRFGQFDPQFGVLPLAVTPAPADAATDAQADGPAEG
jgi:hypothetical protein